MSKKNPVVFIHYSWDSEQHKDWILSLANRLVADGVDVIFDRFDLRLGTNTTYFMEKVTTADKILVIMTTSYKLKADDRSGGAGYEFQIIASEINSNLKSTKILPLLKEGNKNVSIPKILQSFTYLDIINDIDFEKNYITLLSEIYNEPIIKKPPLGKKPKFISSKGETITPSIEEIVDVGFTREKIHKLLGKPQQSTYLEDLFWSHGIIVYYNRHEDRSDGVILTRLESGIEYPNQFKDIRLGDSFAKANTKLGNPLNWGLPYKDISFAHYDLKNKFLTLSIWRDKPENPPTDFKVGNIQGIGYCQKYSVLACQPLVAITIEEIKNGLSPTYLEPLSEKSIALDFSSSFFHEPYEMSQMQYGKYGGYYIYVHFVISKKTIAIWLYDLSWSEMVIRSMRDLEELKK